MTLLTATDLSQSFGANDIFSDISLQLQAKDRVGLVGPNGVGKTTLLQILAGLQTPHRGEVSFQRGLALGYLQQESVLTFVGHDHTVYEEMLAVFASLREQESQLRNIEAEMADGDGSAALLQAYGRLQEQYELQGGYQYQVEIKRVLLGLGFEQPYWDTPISHLSGGEKTRVLLGRLLLEKPDLLILDEPTNHLDVAAIEWLEQVLRQWPGALIIVSHDRYFLDRVINRVWEMRPNQLGGIRDYRGNYTAFVQQRELEWQQELQLFKAEKSRLEKEIQFIRKHIAGGKSDIAKGKLKRMTRDITLIENATLTGTLAKMQGKSWLEIGGRVRTLSVNEADKRVRALRPPAGRPPRLDIRLRVEERSGRIVLRTGELKIGYPGTLLFSTDRIRLERLDCTALIGPNGSGKSTFLRVLMGELPTLKGWIKFGDSLVPGYFAQGHDQLNMAHRVIDEVMGHSEMNEAQARDYLAPYQFRSHDVFKRVGDLSGGERGRLALAVLALSGANFLLLDEPTNHLDIPSQEALQSVLSVFDGTILLVSHDRYLINRLATQIWEIRDNHLYIQKGSYQEYLRARQEAEVLDAGAVGLDDGSSPPALDWVESISAPPIGKKAQAERAHRLAELEAEIDDAEIWLERIEFELQDANADGDETQAEQLRDELVVMQARLDRLLNEWNELMG